MKDGHQSIFIDPAELPRTGAGFVQVLFLGVVYSYILYKASCFVSNGSELLLLIPSISGIVGSVVLPVLGSLPDGALVLFSGLGENAQAQLSVGVGALAGSTVMLLTVPWAIGVYAGRVDLINGSKGNYIRPKNAKGWRKLTRYLDLHQTGVVVSSEVSQASAFMLCTSLIYLVIQVPALQYTGTNTIDNAMNRPEVASALRIYAIIAMALCVVLFVAYLAKNILIKTDSDELKRENVIIDALKANDLSLLGALQEEILLLDQSRTTLEDSSGFVPLLDNAELTSRMSSILRPFYKKYDNNNDGTMDMTEFRLLFTDFHEDISTKELEHEFALADTNCSGTIEFHEFVQAVINILQRKAAAGDLERLKSMDDLTQTKVEVGNGEPDNEADDYGEDYPEDEDEDDIPSDLAHLNPAEQQQRIKLRACLLMLVGTVLILFFSDPMVDVLSEIGERTGIPPFYVSFVLAPFVSNASELMTAYNYAKRKTSKTITISLSALVGAVCMSNTFCLGIFMALIAFQTRLVWQFSAETSAILFVQWAVAYMAMRSTVHTLYHAALVLLLYPASLMLVFILENVAALD